MTTTAGERITYEVLWGIEENQRGRWVDYGDGMAYSRDAETNATRAFLEMANNGVKVEFCVNGVHRNGYDFAAEWAEWNRWCAEQDAQEAAERAAWEAEQAAVAHKTRTFQRDSIERHWHVKPNGRAKGWRPDSSIAGFTCTCGVKEYAGDRHEAQMRARVHRETEAAKQAELDKPSQLG